MGFLGSIFGSSSNYTEVQNNTVNSAIISAVVKVGNDAGAITVQNATLDVAGDVTISGDNADVGNISQSVTVNMQSMMKAEINEKLQQQIKDELTSQIKQAASSFPVSLSDTSNSSKTINNMTNNINASFGVDAINKAIATTTSNAAIKLGGNLKVTGNNDKAFNISQVDAVTMTMANDLTAKIADDLKVDNAADTSVDQTITNFLADIVKAVGDTISGPFKYIAIVVVVIVVGVVLSMIVGVKTPLPQVLGQPPGQPWGPPPMGRPPMMGPPQFQPQMGPPPQFQPQMGPPPPQFQPQMGPPPQFQPQMGPPPPQFQQQMGPQPMQPQYPRL